MIRELRRSKWCHKSRNKIRNLLPLTLLSRQWQIQGGGGVWGAAGWGYQGPAPPLSPNSFIFMQFLHTPLGNPRSATAQYEIILLDRSFPLTLYTVDQFEKLEIIIPCKYLEENWNVRFRFRSRNLTSNHYSFLRPDRTALSFAKHILHRK